MSRRIIKKTKFGRCLVTIAKDSFAGEFVVTTKIGAKVQGGKKNGGYFTEDKKDARDTAASIIKRLRREKRC